MVSFSTRRWMAKTPGAGLPAWPTRRGARQADGGSAFVGHDHLLRQVEIDPVARAPRGGSRRRRCRRQGNRHERGAIEEGPVG